jgi:ubiquinone/menaquinone biosynthesis C-methylase UbiE
VDEARLATAFDSVADEYARGRPGYPADAINRLTAEFGLDDDSVVIDLAAGTGKLTSDLVERFETVIAIEPLAEMRRELARLVPGAEVREGSAEAMSAAAASAHAVFVAQAFHWFDGDRALAEAMRVLKPQGGLGLLWNTTPWELREGPWFAALDDLLEELRVDLSTMRRHASGRWMEAFERDTSFGPLSSETFANPQRTSRADFLAGLASRSYIAALAPADRAEVMKGIDALLAQDDAPVEGDDVIAPMRTAVFWTRLRT